jgi:quercetin dioxygenase-like cupin family protein
MKTEEELLQGLRDEGYDSVYVWDAPPGETEDEHQHPFNTRIIVVAGTMHIKVLRGERFVEHDLRPGLQIEIEKGEPHAAFAGPEGCRYIVGEMH